MKTFIIVKKDDLSVQGSYDANQKDDSSANRSHLMAEPRCAHVEMPEGLDKNCLKAELVEKWTKPGEEDALEAPVDWEIEGWTHEPEAIVVSEDQNLLDAKVQSRRNSKLATLRSIRQQKLEEADAERKKHEDSDPNAIGTAQAWSDYRIALRNVTDSYKYANDHNRGKANLDTFADDMSDFTWPEKP